MGADTRFTSGVYNNKTNMRVTLKKSCLICGSVEKGTSIPPNSFGVNRCVWLIAKSTE